MHLQADTGVFTGHELPLINEIDPCAQMLGCRLLGSWCNTGCTESWRSMGRALDLALPPLGGGLRDIPSGVRVAEITAALTAT